MSLSAFLKGNAVQKEQVKYVASTRFLSEERDAKGDPIPEAWVLRAVSARENDAIQQECTRQVPVPGRKNQYRQEMDNNAYLRKLTAASVVYPNLNDKELQDSYQVMGAEALLTAMLTAGEYVNLSSEVVEVCGFTGMQEAVDTAKNS